MKKSDMRYELTLTFRLLICTLSLSPSLLSVILDAQKMTCSSSLHAAFVSSPPKLSNHRSPHRLVCRAHYTPTDLNLLLHHALDSSGIDTAHARAAREGFCSQIKKLSTIERETSICINRCVDLGKTALHIAAEDDSLISHSSVPLPVDAFIDRLDDLSMGYCPNYRSSFRSSPESFLENIERYLFAKKGFRRNNVRDHLEPRALYLHSVLTHRSGSAVMLSLIYSEILKMLRLWSLVDFDVEISFPLDFHSLPKAYQKQKSKESDQPHIMTVQTLLEEILRTLKNAFWPFQHDNFKSLFLRAAHAANCVDKLSSFGDSALQIASAKAAQHRLDRGVWTTVRFGDMRRALAACERLILLGTDAEELRDYSILLYHCGFYEHSLQYLKLYQELKEQSSKQGQPSNSVSSLEDDAVEKLMVRLNLILMEEGWSKPSYVRNYLAMVAVLPTIMAINQCLASHICTQFLVMEPDGLHQWRLEGIVHPRDVRLERSAFFIFPRHRKYSMPY